MEVRIVVHPQRRNLYRGGGESVVHLIWGHTAGRNEPRGRSEERAKRDWLWQRNQAGVEMNWHCWVITNRLVH